MTLSEAELHIADSRRKLATYGEMARDATPDKVLQLIRDEIVRLEMAAQTLPHRGTKIHRLIQAWRRCHSALWAGGSQQIH
ncbi:MAG TPA: hypothetical protein VGB81_16850 [Devosia sp.]|jgi:hypothetical protein